MSSLKRSVLVIIAAVMFMTASFSAYAAASPTKEDYVTMTTDDGVEVILWRMPDYLDKLSEQTKQLYAAIIDLARQGLIEVYIGEVQEGKHKGDALILTRYPQKAAIIDDENRSAIDDAYVETQEAEGHLETLTPQIEDKAVEAGVPIEECKVTDVFDLTYYRLTDTWRKSHDHGKINVKFTADRLKNFVGLMHRNKGKWETVMDAKITGEARDTLTFSATDLSPFAVVTWGDEGVGTGAAQSPKTGDNTLIWAGTTAAAVLLLSAAAYVLVVNARKRRS